ncbi:glycosyltransferase family 2 protein [Deinococcus sp. YIM 77859]|uniref:glycosyltransferase family 2 protein n=1 Tax=Deinococcus sp. YIM 77859 TaxID=1540221 RepID=UPI00068D65B9|nr:glycosyltransferase family 2 protein [Deinococcus sp. YIM 77859]
MHHDVHPPLLAPLDRPRPLISVVIPTFNRPELLLRRGLRSALAQRYPNLEVLVVMDGPDPSTEAALGEISDPRLRLLALPSNSGPSDARNLGVQAARGEWIAFLDDDDEWRPDKLARQMEAAQRSSHRFPVVFSGLIGRTPHGDRLHPHRQKQPGERLGDYLLVRRSHAQPECVLVCSVIFAPRELLLAVPFTSGLRAHEDWDWMLRAEQTPGVGFEQLPREDASSLTIYYFGENRPAGSQHSVWRPSLAWAQRQRRAGRLSERAFAGFLLFQVVPRAVEAGDWSGLPTLGLALLSTRPTPYELLRFLKHWAIPLPLRRRVRHWLNTRREPARLEGWEG